MAAEPVGIAIIGGGIFVKTQHIPAALASPLTSVKAIWSRSLKSAREAAAQLPPDHPPVDLYSADGGDSSKGSFDDVLARADVAGVVLALPIVDQPAYVAKALRAGKHVLAEKPVAKDVASARELVALAREARRATGATFAVAENYRFSPSWSHAAEQVARLGGATGFVARFQSLMETDNKYYGTAWRAQPAYQGGFLLDGGVHYTAALRRVLGGGGGSREGAGGGTAVESLTAHTALVSSHLAPLDSINAVLRTSSGAVGSYVHSCGTTLRAAQIEVACRQGVVVAEGSRVVVTKSGGGGGQEDTTEEKTWERSSGVKEEVHAWAESIVSGQPNPDQSAEEALGDLELLEKMLTSGDHDGARQVLEFQ